MNKIKYLLCGLFVCLMAISINSNDVKAMEYTKTEIPQIFIETVNEGDDIENKDKLYVPTKITVVDKEGGENEDIIEELGNTKLHGNSTSQAKKKPYKIKFESKKNLFGMGKAKKWTLLANAFDKTLIRNKLGFDLAKKMNLAYTSECVFVDLWVNGEFKGNYLLIEPVEDGTTRVDIDPEGNDFMLEIERERVEDDVTYVETKKLGMRFAVDAPEETTPEKVQQIKSVTATLEDALSTHKYSEYSKYIDVDSFVNYYIACELLKAVDVNYSSTRFYYKDGKMFAGPLWDVDLAIGNADNLYYSGYFSESADGSKGLFANQVNWFAELLKDQAFVDKVVKRYGEIYPTVENMYKTNSLGTNQIDLLVADMKASIDRNYASKEDGGAGWSMTYKYSRDIKSGWIPHGFKGLEVDPESTYEANVEKLRTFLNSRAEWLKTKWGSINVAEDENNAILEEFKKVAVTYLNANQKAYNSATLMWGLKGKVEGFEISYRISNGSYKVYKNVSSTTKTLDITGLTPNKSYYFRIRGYRNNYHGKKIYTPYKVSTICTLKLDTPKAKVKLKGKKITVTWKKIKGAKGYRVYLNKYKKGKNKNKFKKIKTIKKASTVKYIYKSVKKGYVYSFKVKAY